MPTPAHYELPGAAGDYRDRFSRSWSRRLSHALEMRMLRRALAMHGPCDRLLDVPCGAGRLIPTLEPLTRTLVCADGAFAMVAEAHHPRVRGGAHVLQALGHRLPFADGAFDATVCWRLLHHFDDPAARAALLRELGRVTRKTIVMSFWDADTSRARRIRRRGGTKGGRSALTRAALTREIEDAGLEPVRFFGLFGAFSPTGAVVIRKRV